MFQLKRTRSSESRLGDKPADKGPRVCLHQLFQTLVPGFGHSDGLLPLPFSVAYDNPAVEGKDIRQHLTFVPLSPDHRVLSTMLCPYFLPGRDLTVIRSSPLPGRTHRDRALFSSNSSR